MCVCVCVNLDLLSDISGHIVWHWLIARGELFTYTCTLYTLFMMISPCTFFHLFWTSFFVGPLIVKSFSFHFGTSVLENDT